jgi:hypothetical protein
LGLNFDVRDYNHEHRDTVVKEVGHYLRAHEEHFLGVIPTTERDTTYRPYVLLAVTVRSGIFGDQPYKLETEVHV